MSKKIKNFWLKIGTMFLTLYFMPFANFIRGIFGLPHIDQAYAGTVRCNTNNNGVQCPGKPDTLLTDNQTIQCTCATDSSKVFDVRCGTIWDEVNSTWLDELVTGMCYTPGACSPNGKTEDCSTSSRNGTRKCVNGKWSACEYGECKSGYVLVDGGCYATCDISNGTGYEIDIATSSSSTEA